MTGPTLIRVLKPNDYGKDVQGVRRACRKFLGMTQPSAPISVQRKFNASMTELVKAAQDEAVIPKSGWVGPELMGALRRADAFDAYATQLIEQYAEENAHEVPPLGPIVAGDKTVLLHQLTHNTDGVPGYPAFDTGFSRAGVAVLAPEPLVVTKQSGAQGGDAFYATGVSSLRYWFGHVAWSPPTGAHFRKGQMMSRIANQPAGHVDHVHLGIDAKPLIGKSLLYGANGHGPDYTEGSPAVGIQLKAAL